MASAPPSPPPSSLDVELSPPVLVTMNSSSSDIEEENVDLGFESPRGFNLGYAVLNRGQLLARESVSDMCFNYFGVALVFCFFASVLLIGGFYGPENVWLGPNSSILVESNSIFVKSLKVKEMDDTKAGLQLFRFYRSPLPDVFVNWSESRLLSISHDSYKGWPFYLNKGSSLNISYTVKPHGSAVQFVVNKGSHGISQSSLNDNALQDTAWSWSLIQGSGKIEFEIIQSSSYYVAVINLERKDVEVELDIDVRAILYDTKQSYYNCTLSNGMYTFNATSLIGHSVVVTSPAPSQGISLEDEWHIMFSYEPRWSAYIISTGMVLCFTLVALCFCNRIQCCGGETENDLARTRLLQNKDGDGSSMGSCSDDNDADLEDVIGKDGEASNSSRRSCVICFDAPRDCFFLPCGHCVSCYQCGTKIAEGDGNCPLCRRRMKKVKRIYIA